MTSWKVDDKLIDDPVAFHKKGKLSVKAWVFTSETGWIFRELTNKELALWVKLGASPTKEGG